MRGIGKFARVIIYLSCLAVGILSLLIFVVSLVTTVVFRQYEQNDLFDFVRDNTPLLLLCMLAVLALMTLVELLAERKESGTAAAAAAARSGTGTNEAGAADAESSAHSGTGTIDNAESDAATAGKIETTGATGAAHTGSSATAGKELWEKAPFPWLMLIVGGAVSIFLVVVIRGLPTADGLTLDNIINQFLEGNYSAFNKGGYLDVYPFQVFYVYIGEVLAHLFGPPVISSIRFST